MKILVIHAATGDTVVGVVRTEELDMMGIEYTELSPYTQSAIDYLRDNRDLCDDVDLLLSTILHKRMFNLI